MGFTDVLTSDLGGEGSDCHLGYYFLIRREVGQKVVPEDLERKAHALEVLDNLDEFGFVPLPHTADLVIDKLLQ